MNSTKVIASLFFTMTASIHSFATETIQNPHNQSISEINSSLVCIEAGTINCTVTLIGNSEDNKLIAKRWGNLHQIMDTKASCDYQDDKIICTKDMRATAASFLTIKDLFISSNPKYRLEELIDFIVRLSLLIILFSCVYPCIYILQTVVLIMPKYNIAIAKALTELLEHPFKKKEKQNEDDINSQQ